MEMSENRPMREADEARRLNESEGEIDLLVLLADMTKKFKTFWWVVLLFIVAFSLALGGYKRVTYVPVYRASATFAVNRRLLTSTGNDSYGYSYDYGTVSQLTDTFPYIVSSDLLMNIVAQQMGTDYVYANIYASGVEDTNIFTIYVEATNANYAYQVLMGVIENYPQIAEYVIGDTQLSMLIDPVVPGMPYNSSQALKYALMGGLAGAFLGLGFLFLLAYFNNSVKTLEDVSKMLNQNPLGVLPRAGSRRANRGVPGISILHRAASSGLREAVRSLRTRLLRDMDERGAKVLMVTSATAGEGKSTVAANIAISIAQRHVTVILVDADMRRASMVNYLGIRSPQYTYLDVAAGTASLRDALVDYRVEGLRCLECGKLESPIEVLGSPEFAETIRRLRMMADFVIIDTPPCGMLADASAFAPACDAALFVIKQDGPSKWQILDALEAISYTGLPVVGCVLNDVPSGFTGYGYGYGYSQRNYAGAYAKKNYESYSGAKPTEQ